MLDKYRNKVDFILEPIAKKIDIEPNILTYISLLFAFFSSLATYFSYEYKYLLILSSLFILINGFLDAMDGKIARIKGKESKKGDFIDHAIDRFSDAFIMGGIIASQWVNKIIGISAFASVMLVSYLGTQAQAVGYKRIYGGILGRADRIAILFFALLIQFFLPKKIYGFYFLDFIMLYFIVAGIITILQRYMAAIKYLSKP